MVLSYYRNGSVRGSDRSEELEKIIARTDEGGAVSGQLFFNFEEEQLCIYEPPSPGSRGSRRFWGPEPELRLVQENKRA
jgi:hypothetical protein